MQARRHVCSLRGKTFVHLNTEKRIFLVDERITVTGTIVPGTVVPGTVY